MISFVESKMLADLMEEVFNEDLKIKVSNLECLQVFWFG